MALEDDAAHQRSAHRNGRAPGRAREAESRSGKGEEAGGNGEHVPATGETGGEAGREIGVRVETGHKPTQKEPSGYPKPSLIRLELSLSPNDGFCGPDRTREHGGGSVPA